MKTAEQSIRQMNALSELHRHLHLPQPLHPLLTVLHLEQLPQIQTTPERVNYNFYQVCLKQNFAGKLKYGQQYYDFDNGVLSFIAPGQVLSSEGAATEGWVLLIHPDFLQGHPLGKTIREYGFFSYELTEALFVSEKEQQVLQTIVANIETEYSANIDAYSQDIILAQIELLLQYAARFYNRQFLTRKKANTHLLAQAERLLADYFSSDAATEKGLPTVEWLAGQLHLSPHYCSDLLRSTTGLTAQQHIQNHLMEKAKNLLSTTGLSVGEIAYRLGFKHTQSFNKLFKNKMGASPLQYRESFN